MRRLTPGAVEPHYSVVGSRAGAAEVAGGGNYVGAVDAEGLPGRQVDTAIVYVSDMGFVYVDRDFAVVRGTAGRLSGQPQLFEGFVAAAVQRLDHQRFGG